MSHSQKIVYIRPCSPSILVDVDGFFILDMPSNVFQDQIGLELFLKSDIDQVLVILVEGKAIVCKEMGRDETSFPPLHAEHYICAFTLCNFLKYTLLGATQMKGVIPNTSSDWKICENFLSW